jgi:tetratricopeptide (TPR) repeat protein
MKRLSILLAVATLVTPLARGENSPSQQLVDSLNLIKQAQFLPAINELEALTSANGLTRLEQGRAFTLLGYCYKENGRFEAAQRSYERAIALVENNSDARLDYANAMNNLADLYRDTNRLDQAKQAWQKSESAYSGIGDHSGVAGIAMNLAGIAIVQNHLGDAKKLIARAQEEFKLAEGMTDSEKGGMAVTEAWLADAHGHHDEALDDYQRALHAWQHAHGEAHPITGWGWVLLGRAEANVGRFDDARAFTQQGMSIIAKTEGESHPRYQAAQLLYSQVLDMSGSHAEAAVIRTSAEHSLSDVLGRQCTSCTVSVATLMAR